MEPLRFFRGTDFIIIYKFAFPGYVDHPASYLFSLNHILFASPPTSTFFLSQKDAKILIQNPEPTVNIFCQNVFQSLRDKITKSSEVRKIGTYHYMGSILSRLSTFGRRDFNLKT